MVQTTSGPAGGDPNDKFDDEDYPAYSMGSAAQILGTTQDSFEASTRRTCSYPTVQKADIVATHAISYGWQPEPANSSIEAPPWKLPAASSFSKTNSQMPKRSTPNSTVA